MAGSCVSDRFPCGTSFLALGPVSLRAAGLAGACSPPHPTPPRGLPRRLLTLLFSVSLRPSLVKPLRHYAVFLSEDSSDEECQREEGLSSGFTESFFFSAPFEWSLLPSSISLS